MYRYKPDETVLELSLEKSGFLNTLSVTFQYKRTYFFIVDKMEWSCVYCNMSLSIFLGWHKVMESIDCALELGYDPVKVNFC